MIYTKTVDDHQIFSDCRVVSMDDGTWISNPTDEQIAAAGWVLYTPPPYVPQPTTEPDNIQIIEAVKKMLATSVESLSDEEALEVAALYPTWKSKVGLQVNVGERLWYNEALYKVIQAHTVQEDWTPDVTASLYTEVSIDEWPEIPENIPSTAPWMKGDKGTWKGEHYICDMDNCVWNPDVAPSFWIKQ